MQLIHNFKRAFLYNRSGRVILDAGSTKFDVVTSEILDNVQVFQTNIGIKIKADLLVTSWVKDMPMQEAKDKKIFF